MNRVFSLFARFFSFVLVASSLAACAVGGDDTPAGVAPQPRGDGEGPGDDAPGNGDDEGDGDGPSEPGTDAPPAPPPAPTMMVATRDTVLWKRHRALENDLLRALSLSKSELCREVETFSCIDEAHLAALGGNSPIELAHYVPLAAPTVTTPMAIERIVLSGCSRRAELDASLPASSRVLFTAFPLQAGTVVDASGLDALGTTLHRRFLGRDPSPEELAALQPLRDDGTAAIDVAKLACFAIGSSVEFAFQYGARLASLSLSLSPPEVIPMNAIKTNRRSLLKSGAAALAALGTAPLFARSARAQNAANRKYLFVVGAFGGASIIDGFLPITQSAAGYFASQLSQPAGSNLRCPKPLNSTIQGVIALGDGYNMSTFLSKHSADTVVMTQEGTSVNHQVAARRAITGNNINQGRTLLEAMALRYGEGLVLPACAMGGGGYADPGDDVTVPDDARAEPVMDARLFAFSTHGTKGVSNAPDKALVDRARAVRSALEQRSGFGQTFGRTSAITRFTRSRDVVGPSMEASDLITKLMMLPPDATDRPLIEQGLETSADGQLVLSTYPNLMKDPFDAQAALAFLLVKNGVSCAVTLAPSPSPVFAEGGARAYTAPLGFDWSHTDHRGAQNAMWGRVMHVVDGLVDLLKGAESPSGGGSLWDQSLIYIATEFGRDKIGIGGSGHHLNNGNVLISPLLNGNRVYGGVDPQTGLTHGFDPNTGDPTPNTVMREGDVYSAICHALDIDFAGRRDMPCMIRA